MTPDEERARIAAIADGLTVAQRFAGSKCGDLLDSFPCRVCAAKSPRDCKANPENKAAYIDLIQKFGSLDAVRAYLKEPTS